MMAAGRAGGALAAGGVYRPTIVPAALVEGIIDRRSAARCTLHLGGSHASVVVLDDPRVIQLLETNLCF